MSVDLTGVHAKIDRAYEHLHALDEEARKFLRRYPYGVRQECQLEGRRHISTMEIFREPDTPTFGLLIGDCANNLRCALDHLVSAVARDTLTAKAFRQYEQALAFPICASPAEWAEALRRHRLEGMPASALAEIERRQPYQTRNPPQQAPLALLQWINNRDKHRLLHTVAGYLAPAQIDFTPEVPAGSQWRFGRPPYTESGTEILSVELPHPIPDMQMKFQLMLQISLREAPVTEDVREVLLQAGQTVQRIVAEVAKHC
jgi:hypothetical protein